jgi:hypothetical protein
MSKFKPSLLGARKEIVNRLRGDQGCVVTTMVDYYGMPQAGARAWPGRADAARQPGALERAAQVQDAVRASIAESMGKRFDERRLAPYVMMHEFEAMLFSDCSAFAYAIGREELAG